MGEGDLYEWLRQYWKPPVVLFSALFAISGSVLTGLGANATDACVDLQIAGITGAVYTGFSIILAAIASL